MVFSFADDRKIEPGDNFENRLLSAQAVRDFEQ
jgi:hypothetical protein